MAIAGEWNNSWDWQQHNRLDGGLIIWSASANTAVPMGLPIGIAPDYGATKLKLAHTGAMRFSPVLVCVDDPVSELAVDDFCHTDNNREQRQEIIDEP